MARNPKSASFLRNRDVEDLLYLIHEDLRGIISSAGGSASGNVLLVKGSADYGDGTIFVPDAGEADFATAKACFLAGGTVLLSYTNAFGDSIVSAVASYHDYGENVEHLSFRKYGVNVDAEWQSNFVI